VAEIKTLIVDDEEDLRLLLRLAIERRNEGLVVAGEAAAGDEALLKLDELDPKVVVLDQMMPGMDGLETARRILERRPEQLIVLYSALMDAELEAQATAIGIAGCMRKGKAKELADFVHALADGAA
jgi:DNA-binding NarL/FixJ family response regulator